MQRTAPTSVALLLAVLALTSLPSQRARGEAPPPARAVAPSDDVSSSFDGEWQTSFGRLTLKQTGHKVEGEYDNPPGKVNGTVSGRKLTSFPSIKTDVRNAGGNWVDEEVVVDSGLVTSRQPDDLPAFNDKLVEEFCEGRHAEQAQKTRA